MSHIRTFALPRLRAMLVLFAVLPMVTGLLLVRPAEGQVSQFGIYALTASGGPVVMDGDIGAGGGLTAVDGGAPYGQIRLDASPSSFAKAAAVEPGSLFRTAVGVVNTEAGEEVVDVPTAEASYPGDLQESDGDGLGSVEESGGRFAGATAHVEAHALDALVRAEGGQSDIPGAYLQEGGTLDITAVADPAAGILGTTVVSRSGRTSFAAGAFVIDSVVGVVVTSVTPEGRVVDAGTTVSGATVAGVPVLITEDGVIADGNPTVPGQPLADAQEVVNSVLVQAGIEAHALAPREESEGGSLLGDSGGVQITIHTEPTPAAPGNTLIMTLGKATATSFDDPPFVPAPSVSVPAVDQAGGSAGAGTSPGAVSSGSGSVGGSGSTSGGTVPPTASGAPAPQVAAPVTSNEAGGSQLLLAGRRLPTRLVLAAFGGWQLLSLSTCTLAVFALRNDPIGGDV